MRQLLQHFGSIDAILSAARADLLPFFHGDQTPVDTLRAGPDPGAFETERLWLQDPRNHLIVLTAPDYPPLLREIADPPALLFVRGDPALLAAPQLAVVGSRNPTRGGSDNARAFSASLAQAGLAVTSGLALGIDASAHQAALGSIRLRIANWRTGSPIPACWCRSLCSGHRPGASIFHAATA